MDEKRLLKSVNFVNEYVINANNFKIDRKFITGNSSYASKFPSVKDEFSLERSILNCENCHLLDIGAGELFALAEAIELNPNGIQQAVGLAVKKPSSEKLNEFLLNFKNLIYLESYIEKVNPQLLFGGKKADRIFDIMSASQYTHDLVSVYRAIHNLSNTNSLIYISFITGIAGGNRYGAPAHSLTKFIDKEGFEISPIEFYEKFKGFDIVHHENLVFSSYEKTFSIILRKNSEKFESPKMRTVLYVYSDDSVPTRYFQILE